MARPVRLHLSWRRNGDNFDVALAVNRLLAHNHPVWWCLKPAGTVEAGDYLLECPSGLAERLSALNVSTVRWSGRLPPGAQRLEPPRVSLLAGRASGYPYFAYYALCLTRLGLSYDPVGGAEIGQRGLRGANLFVLPGGFATRGLDIAEKSPGADAVVRAFLERGGACIGSMEVPNYDGPSYDAEGPGVEVAGVFHHLCLPGRLAIDNPLKAHRFKRELAGRPAILRAQGSRGRAFLFSPHPEMGDLVRKYVALDGYVRRYLPIRGRRTMEETLRAYRPLDSPSFHMILNATHALMLTSVGRSAGGAQKPAGVDRHPVRWLSRLRSFQEATSKLLASSRVARSTAYDAVVRSVATELAARLSPVADDLARALHRLSEMPSPETRRLLNAWSHLAGQATHTLTRGSRSSHPVAERLLHAELAICLWEAWRRLIEGELAIAPLRPLR